MTSLGQELKKDREARGISLKAVADATRINQRYLEAVESDQLDTLPGGFFVKGILRSYAKAVGLDEEEVLERYRQAGILAAGKSDMARKQALAPEAGGSKKRARSLAGAAAAVIVIVSFAVYFLTRPGKPDAPPADVSPSPAATNRPEQAPSAAPSVGAAGAPEAEKGLRLEMAFVAETWIQVYADGRLAMDGLRSTGDSAEVRADAELLVHLGNAGGLTYTLNGKPGKPFGRAGAVVKNIRITAGNLRSFLPEGQIGVE